MNKLELLEKLDHDLASTIRNFQVATGLLTGDASEVAMATELLSASIEQLESTRKFVLKESSINNFGNSPSIAAQK